MFHCFPVGDVENNGIFSNKEIVPQKIGDLEIFLKSCCFKLQFSGLLVVVEGDSRKTKNT